MQNLSYRLTLAGIHWAAPFRSFGAARLDSCPLSRGSGRGTQKLPIFSFPDLKGAQPQATLRAHSTLTGLRAPLHPIWPSGASMNFNKAARPSFSVPQDPYSGRFLGSSLPPFFEAAPGLSRI
ncbi:Protein of unknown function [Pyronema omphalodes CBS 100304]|uniref:Uncharacterized protein n=1 Tax=Pyronema omphalodes (strain CBS 100304) TaxID=1076935 RepID=U4KX46_PYROM|nr:Protein of unknown function [Pyronema omphalodes CBS 100304]